MSVPPFWETLIDALEPKPMIRPSQVQRALRGSCMVDNGGLGDIAAFSQQQHSIARGS